MAINFHCDLLQKRQVEEFNNKRTKFWIKKCEQVVNTT